MIEIENYTQEEFSEIFERIYKEETRNVKKAVSPTAAYVLGGQPGSGKTTIIRLIKDKLKEAIVINGDDYRKMHPHFHQLYKKYGNEYVNYTNSFVSQIVEKLIEKSSSDGYNLIIEGTLRTTEIPLKTADTLLKKGYNVNLAVMAVHPTISYVGTIKRYEQMREMGKIPRAVTKEQHDITAQRLVHNLGIVYDSRVFDNILLYNRDGKCLYNMKSGSKGRPEKILFTIHNRSLTNNEIIQCKKDISYIKKCLKTREDKTSDIFKQHCNAVTEISNTLKKLMNQVNMNRDLER